jgi:uncharacterized protein (TIGR04255 family)
MGMAAAKRPHDLPDFERPPLNELVLSIQFGSLPLKNFHAGLLWQRFAMLYPKVEEQPPLEPVFETFGAPQAREAQATLQFTAVPGTLRYWFVSHNENELVQIQGDRLVHNWRQRSRDDQYPRYEVLREKLEWEIATAAEFFREYDIGEIACNQCEVSYINAISLDDDSELRPSDILTSWQEQYSDDYLSGLELETGRTRFNVSFVIPAESGKEPLGRLHILAQPVILRLTGRLAMQLTVTARGRPRDENVASSFAWLDEGRRAAVRAFTSITTQKMHRLWGRKPEVEIP